MCVCVTVSAVGPCMCCRVPIPFRVSTYKFNSICLCVSLLSCVFVCMTCVCQLISVCLFAYLSACSCLLPSVCSILYVPFCVCFLSHLGGALSDSCQRLNARYYIDIYSFSAPSVL